MSTEGFGQGLAGLVELLRVMAMLCVTLVPLGLWKLVEIVLWLIG